MKKKMSKKGMMGMEMYKSPAAKKMHEKGESMKMKMKERLLDIMTLLDVIIPNLLINVLGYHTSF